MIKDRDLFTIKEILHLSQLTWPMQDTIPCQFNLSEMLII